MCCFDTCIQPFCSPVVARVFEASVPERLSEWEVPRLRPFGGAPASPGVSDLEKTPSHCWVPLQPPIVAPLPTPPSPPSPGSACIFALQIRPGWTSGDRQILPFDRDTPRQSAKACSQTKLGRGWGDPSCLDHPNPPPMEKHNWWGQDSVADLQEKIGTASCGEESTGDCPGPRKEATDGLHVTQGVTQGPGGQGSPTVRSILLALHILSSCCLSQPPVGTLTPRH